MSISEGESWGPDPWCIGTQSHAGLIWASKPQFDQGQNSKFVPGVSPGFDTLTMTVILIFTVGTWNITAGICRALSTSH